MQRCGNRMRFSVQLIDTETGNHLWAQRFDKPVADPFDMQDEIVARLANAVGAQLYDVEARRAELKPNLDATDLCFRGRAWVTKGFTPDNLAEARSCFERALELEPENFNALVGIAFVDASVAGSFCPEDRNKRLAAAEAAVIKALSLAPEFSFAHICLGVVQILTNRFDQAFNSCERALTLNPNLAAAHALIGIAKMHVGRVEETERHIQEALRLSPNDTHAFVWFAFAGYAKLCLAGDEDAVRWLLRSIDTNRNYPVAHFWLAAALAHRGRLDDAWSAVRVGLALNPTFTISRFRASLLSDSPTFLAQRERICDGLRKAGAPEG